jgi:peptide/nickel transport system substrate-binding protein
MIIGTSRRDFMKLAAGTAAGAAAVPLLNACGSSGSSSSAGGKATTLFTADIADIAPIDPAQYSSTITRTMIRNVYEPLVYYQLGGYALQPRLATSWTGSPDGLSYTFKLRQGVRFHSGAKFTANDVKTTFDRVLAIGQNVPQASLSGSLKSTTVVDDFTVRFDLNFPYVYFAQILPKIPIISAADVTAHQVNNDWAHAWFSKNANGTGLYKFTKWVPDQYYTLQRNTAWWSTAPAGAFDRVYSSVITDGSTYREQLDIGQLDLASDWISILDKVNAAKADPNTVKTVPGSMLLQLLMQINASKPPMDNKLLRQAVVAAFPYEKMLSYYQGYSQLPIGIFAKQYPGISQSAYQPVGQDLAKARSLLAQAGHPHGGFTLTYNTPAGTEDDSEVGLLLQGALSQLGIGLNIVSVPVSTWVAKGANASTAGHFNPQFDAPETPDPFQWLQKMLGNKGYLNWSYAPLPQIDQIIHQGQHATDTSGNAALLNQAMSIALDEAVLIPIAHPTHVATMNSGVDGYVFDVLDLQGVPKFWPLHGS